eukprot:1176818-Prorocentrum_minimum.AAC.3
MVRMLGAMVWMLGAMVWMGYGVDVRGYGVRLNGRRPNGHQSTSMAAFRPTLGLVLNAIVTVAYSVSCIQVLLSASGNHDASAMERAAPQAPELTAKKVFDFNSTVHSRRLSTLVYHSAHGISNILPNIRRIFPTDRLPIGWPTVDSGACCLVRSGYALGMLCAV